MLTGTHIKLAKYIYHIFKEQYGINLSKKNLIYGSIKPDFMKNKVPHYIDKSIDYMDTEIERLIFDASNIGIKSFSRRLGMIMHYISDYFCRAHNTSYYRNNMMEHLRYEKRLAKKMTMKKIKMNIENEIKIDTVKEFIMKLNKEYMKQKSLERDREYTVKAINILSKYIVEEIIMLRNLKVA